MRPDLTTTTRHVHDTGRSLCGCGAWTGKRDLSTRMINPATYPPPALASRFPAWVGETIPGTEDEYPLTGPWAV